MNSPQVLKKLLHPITLLSLITLIVLSYFYVDIYLAQSIHHWSLHNYIFFKIATGFGDGMMMVIPLLLACWFRFIKIDAILESRCWFSFLSMITAGLTCLPLKAVFGRARPELWFQFHEYGFYWFQTQSTYWSFPSGHSAVILGAVSSLSLLFPKYRYFFIVPGFFIAFTRVLLERHYLSDVLIASYLALLEAVILLYMFRKKELLC